MGKHETKDLKYVLITPARDEAAFIRLTLEAMVAQTVRPLKWVIVSDGSTDGTDEIVKEFTARERWIELVRMPERSERHFGGKVMAFNAGLERVRGLDYDVIGNLDGDSTFDPDHVEYLLNQFQRNPRLGVGGTNYVEDKWDKALKHDYRYSSIEDVTGQLQLFRRECFEAIGGYKPSRHGGVDVIATVSARMCGWETRVFTGRVLTHHRQQGTAKANPFFVEFHNGRKHYMFGSCAMYELSRAVYRMTKKPVVLGGSLLFIGYVCAMARRRRIVSPEMTRFRKQEQLKRLSKIVRNMFESRRPVTRTNPVTAGTES
jgi:glycosyltransferase involved in cell wall biosynthesis